MQPCGLPRPGEFIRLHPLLCNRWAKTNKYGPNERTDQSSRKKQLSDEERANLSDTELKTLVIRMVTEVVEYGRKIEEKMKAMQSEIQGTNSEGKETGTQIKGLEQKEEINFQPEQNEEKIQKNEERLRNLWDNFKCSIIKIIGQPEGEVEEQEIENLFEQIMKENFPNWQRIFPGSSELQKSWTQGNT